MISMMKAPNFDVNIMIKIFLYKCDSIDVFVDKRIKYNIS